MVDKAPGGKSVGRVTIRVIPDTSKFRTDLRKSLERIENTESMTITVDKVNLDASKIRADIKRQFEALDNVSVDATAKAIVDKVEVRRAEVRESLQRQFDEMGLKVKIAVDLTKAQKDVEEFVYALNRKQGTINVNAATSAATAQMRFLTRARFVDIIPRISQAAYTQVLTQLAALSGVRVTFNWIDDILSAIGRLDENLPKIGLLTSTITTIVSLLFGTISGILAIGAGLSAIVPTLLIIPGLILGTAFAITTFAVAMAEAKNELAPLKDEMQELADIIQGSYWDQARQPIIDLINNLMPQLRNAFANVADSLGGFSAALANAFDRELASGKLEALFEGIAKSFRILSTGADAFAGALVSLSAVAAKYAPRLAQWFVDISIQFDNWLKSVAEDGRLDEWIERGIRAIKDLGRAIRGIALQFYYLWQAANAGGSGGLKGFADSMERFAEVMGSPKFQSTVTAIFRGTNQALTALGDGFVAIGNMLFVLQEQVELFLAASGRIVGTFLEDVASAFATPAVAKGIEDFILGLEEGFARFGESLPKIAEGLASLGSLAGSLGTQLGGILGSALAGLSEVLQPLIDYLAEEFVPAIGPEIKTALEELTPYVKDLAEALIPLIDNLKELLVDVLPAATEGLKGFFQFFDEITLGFLTLATDINLYGALFDDNALNTLLDKARTGVFGFFGDLLLEGEKFDKEFAKNWENFWGGVGQFFTDWGNGFAQGWNDFWGALAKLPELLEQWRIQAIAWIFSVGIDIIVGLAQGLKQAFPGITDFFRTIQTEVNKFLENPLGWLFNVGRDIIQGLINGVKSINLGQVLTDVANTAVRQIKKTLGIQSPSRVFRDEVGAQIAAGLAQGISDGAGKVNAALTTLVDVPSSSLLPLSSLGTSATQQANSTVNYYAAPNASLDSEQALFAAMRRAKVVAGW